MGSSAEMPFLDHLEELRWRIIWSLAAIVVGVIVAFVIVIKFNLLVWMQGPMLPYLHGRRLMNTHPGGGFSISGGGCCRPQPPPPITSPTRTWTGRWIGTAGDHRRA